VILIMYKLMLNWHIRVKGGDSVEENNDIRWHNVYAQPLQNWQCIHNVHISDTNMHII